MIGEELVSVLSFLYIKLFELFVEDVFNKSTSGPQQREGVWFRHYA